jgi:hypothetical protein
MLQYHDDYRRVDGAWFIERRRLHRWYLVDALERPQPGAGVHEGGMRSTALPDGFPTWASFWDEVAASRGEEPS